MRPIGVDEIEAVRARGAEALRLVEEGWAGRAPVSEELTARIEAALRAALKPQPHVDRVNEATRRPGETAQRQHE